jgi:hypothetical protein
MAISRPFSYNTGSPISGTEQVGNLAVGTPTSGFTGMEWWNGPDEELGYVIAQSVPDDSQPTPISGVTASVGFYRTTAFTDSQFIQLANYVANQSYTGATQASTGLTSLGYWNSYYGSPIIVGGSAAASGSSIIYSSQGYVYENSTNGTSIVSLARTLFNDGIKYLVGGDGGSRMGYSNDGLTWSATTNGSSIFTTRVSSIDWNGATYVACGEGTNRIAYSNDGLNWTGSTNGNSFFGINSPPDVVASDGNRFIVGGNGISFDMLYSFDGITWTGITQTGLTRCLDISYNGSRWVAVGQGSNEVIISDDGINWTGSTNGASKITSTANTILWDGNKFLLGGDTGLFYSNDGFMWYDTNYSGALSVNSLNYNGFVYIATTNPSANVYFSIDGINWNPSSSADSLLNFSSSSTSYKLPYKFPPINA